jgi:hypothetical protein
VRALSAASTCDWQLMAIENWREEHEARARATGKGAHFNVARHFFVGGEMVYPQIK